jgi:hypothetical protein
MVYDFILAPFIKSRKETYKPQLTQQGHTTQEHKQVEHLSFFLLTTGSTKEVTQHVFAFQSRP